MRSRGSVRGVVDWGCGMWCEWEPPEFYSERRIKARKPRECCETGREIQPGEFYWRCAGKWDGGLDVFPQSEAAYHFARWLNGFGPDEVRSYTRADACIPFRGVEEHVLEVRDPELAAEWREVKRGTVTRWTGGGEVPAYVRPFVYVEQEREE